MDRKKTLKKNNIQRKILLFLISISTLFMSIGYASINSISLNINGIAQANSQNVIPALKTIYVSSTWTNQGITTISEGVFGNNLNLVGGGGTVFNSSNLSAEYAVIDSDTKKGYLTLKK